VICMRETEKLHNEEFVTRILHQNILNVIKWKMSWRGM
jgi:hypothetical protein